MRVGSLFSGIGGIDLGLERAGMRVIWQAESDAYCRAVLRKHWPDVPCYTDVRDITADAPPVDLVCGGFPCQPASQAGNRLGTADPRWLWPAFAHVVRVVRPRFVFVENVPGLLTVNEGAAFNEVLSDLASLGYDAEWDGIPAAAVGAPHLRDRVWIVAYPNGERPLHGEPAGLAAEAGEPTQRHAGAGSAAGEVRRAPRVFTPLAHANGGGLGRPQPSHEVIRPVVQRGRDARDDARAGGRDRGAEDVADADRGRREQRDQGQRAVPVPDERGSTLPDAHRGRLEVSTELDGETEQGAADRRTRREHADGRGVDLADTNGHPEVGSSVPWDERDPWATEPDVGRVAHGVPSRVDRIRCLGNAVVPQVAEWIGRRLMEVG